MSMNAIPYHFTVLGIGNKEKVFIKCRLQLVQ